MIYSLHHQKYALTFKPLKQCFAPLIQTVSKMKTLNRNCFQYYNVWLLRRWLSESILHPSTKVLQNNKVSGVFQCNLWFSLMGDPAKGWLSAICVSGYCGDNMCWNTDRVLANVSLFTFLSNVKINEKFNIFPCNVFGNKEMLFNGVPLLMETT